MEFFDQFSNKVSSPELDPGIYEPLEGFTGEHVESLSLLVRRLESGQFVNRLEEGIYVDEQVFDSEYMDNFDVMDRSETMRESLTSSRSKRPETNLPSQEGEAVTHNSGVAAPGELSLNPGADNAGK